MLYSIIFYYGMYLTSIIYYLPSAINKSYNWEKYIPKSKNYKLRNVSTKNLKLSKTNINHKKFSENIFYMMSVFFPIYEGGIVKEIHVVDKSKDGYVSQQERKHIKVHTDLNNTMTENIFIKKYLRFIYNLYVSNKFTGIGNYMAEIGFFFKAQNLIPNINNLVSNKNIQKVFAWHLYEEFEHGFDFGLPIIQLDNFILRFFCALVGLIHYRNIWLFCVELPSIALCILNDPFNIFKIIINNLYINTWNKGKMDSLVILATTLQKFPTLDQRHKIEKELENVIKEKYNIDINSEIINF